MHTTVMSHSGVKDSSGVVAGAIATLVAMPKSTRPALKVETKEDAKAGGVYVQRQVTCGTPHDGMTVASPRCIATAIPETGSYST
eukprot:6191269-Prymnesium_polylepis.1